MKSHANTVLVRCALINSGRWYMLETLKIHELKYYIVILQQCKCTIKLTGERANAITNTRLFKTVHKAVPKVVKVGMKNRI